MIDFSAYIKPYSAKNECGDFYLYTQLQDYYLLAVGDIGGHGSHSVFQAANEIKKYLKNHKNENIKELIQKLHHHQSIKNIGMTLFLAQVYKNIPLVNYCAIGNTKSFLFRGKKLLNLCTQDGIIGYDIPSDIKVNMIKVLKNDLLIAVTDGVSLHSTENIASTIGKTRNLQSLTKFLATQSKNDDDSLSVALKFTKSKSGDFSITYEKNNPAQTNKEDQYKPTHKNNLAFAANHPNINNFHKQEKKKLIKFKDRFQLSYNIQKESIDLAINKIQSLTGLNKNSEVKIKTFLHEVVLFCKVEIYIKDNILQLYVENIDKVKNSLEFLFDQYYIFNKNECIINITLDKYIKLPHQEFNNLKKIIKLNLSDKDFELYQAREQFLSSMAYKDTLTQIYNRNKFNHIMKDELIRDERYHRKFSIAIIDIDHFKNFNDKYGHLIGDEVLIMLADCLRDNVRETDTYARWGGEEFILLFPETDSNGAFTAAQQLRKAIEKLSHKTAGGITASFGLTQYIEGDTLDSMFKRCDDALYEAKEKGRNRVCIK